MTGITGIQVVEYGYVCVFTFCDCPSVSTFTILGTTSINNMGSTIMSTWKMNEMSRVIYVLIN